MDKESLEDVRKSYIRLIQQHEFSSAFYQKFMTSSPEVAEKLKAASAIKQKLMISQGLQELIEYTAKGEASERFSQIAKRHDSQHLDILPCWYKLYKKTFLEVLSQFDPECNDDLKNAWSGILDNGIQYFVKHYKC